MLKQEEKGSATAFAATARTTDTMDVVIGIIGRVKLHNPINLREIKTTLCNVSAEENSSLSLTELKVSRRTLLLLLLAVNVLHWHIHVVEQV